MKHLVSLFLLVLTMTALGMGQNTLDPSVRRHDPASGPKSSTALRTPVSTSAAGIATKPVGSVVSDPLRNLERETNKIAVGKSAPKKTVTSGLKGQPPEPRNPRIDFSYSSQKSKRSSATMNSGSGHGAK